MFIFWAIWWYQENKLRFMRDESAVAYSQGQVGKIGITVSYVTSTTQVKDAVRTGMYYNWQKYEQIFWSGRLR